MSVPNINHQQPTVQSIQSAASPNSSFDLGSIPFPDLVNSINPELLEYFQHNTPQVFSALMKQDRRHRTTNVPAPPIPLSTPMPSVPMSDDTNISSLIDEVVSATNSANPTNSASLRTSMPHPQIPIISHPHVNPQQSAIPATSTITTPTNHTAVVPHRPVPLNLHMPVPTQQPQLNPSQAQLTAAQQQVQLSAACARIIPDQQAAINAAARAQVNSPQSSLTTALPHVNSSTSAHIQSSHPHLQSRPHLPATQPQLPAPQSRMTSVTPAVQSFAAPIPNSVLMQSNSAAIGRPKVFVPDRHPRNRAKDLPQKSVVKKDNSTDAFSNKRPTPSNRAQATVSPGAIPGPTMSASQLPISAKMEDPNMDGTGGAEENVEVKKAMRTERNRQSAAASRERKKHHIKELKRRVAALSQENAKLQVDQLKTIKDRIAKERKLLKENKELKSQLWQKDMTITKLNRQLENAGISGGSEDDLKRPSTWDSSEWRKTKGIETA